MRLTEIAHDENPGRSSLLPNAEAEFNKACREISDGDWNKARKICEKLSQQALPGELAEAVRVMNNILDPSNSPSETAEKILQLLPGKIFRVYDD